MNAVEEVELVINRICREKRRRVAFQQAPASTKNIFEMLQPVSTNQQMGIGLTGPTAVPVNYNDDLFPQHLQFKVHVDVTNDDKFYFPAMPQHHTVS